MSFLPGQNLYFVRLDAFDRKSGALDYWHVTCLVCGKKKSMVVQWVANGRKMTCGCKKPSQLPEVKVWGTMIHRCEVETDKDYPHYGGRGIRVCDRWHDFAHFAADMGPRPTPRHSIDRIDVDGMYCPENCRWATFKEQMANRTNSSYLTHNGVRRTISDWALVTGIPRTTLYDRIYVQGWTEEEALTGKKGAPCP